MSDNAVSCSMLFPDVSIDLTVDVKIDRIVLEPVRDSSSFYNESSMSKSDNSNSYRMVLLQVSLLL